MRYDSAVQLCTDSPREQSIDIRHTSAAIMISGGKRRSWKCRTMKMAAEKKVTCLDGLPGVFSEDCSAIRISGCRSSPKLGFSNLEAWRSGGFFRRWTSSMGVVECRDHSGAVRSLPPVIFSTFYRVIPTQCNGHFPTRGVRVVVALFPVLQFRDRGGGPNMG